MRSLWTNDTGKLLGGRASSPELLGGYQSGWLLVYPELRDFNIDIPGASQLHFCGALLHFNHSHAVIQMCLVELLSWKQSVNLHVL